MSFLYALQMIIPDYAFAPIKIGFSRRPEDRAKDLASGPFPSVCLGYWDAPNGFADESAVHTRFREFRLFGEWFYPSPTLLAFLRECIPSAHGSPETTARMQGFERRFRHMKRDSADLPRSSIIAYRNAVNSYMEQIRQRWPRSRFEPELQALTTEEVAVMMSLPVVFVYENLPGFKLSSHGKAKRYRLSDIRAYVENNLNDLVSRTNAA